MVSILVVDDEFGVRNSLRDYLQSKGYKVTVAADAPGAVAALDIAPDLAIVDMMMPDMDGFQLASRLRQIRPGLRILMFTGMPSRAADVRAADLNLYDLLPKSNWYDLLIPTIQKILEAREPPTRHLPSDSVTAATQYAKEGKYELAAGSLEEAARDAEFRHQWSQAAEFYDKAADYYGRSRGVGSLGRERLLDLAAGARRIANRDL